MLKENAVDAVALERKEFEKLYRFFLKNGSAYKPTDKLRWGKGIKNLMSFTISLFPENPEILIEFKADSCWEFHSSKK